MSLTKHLTPDQEALFPIYRDKWRAIAHSTAPIDLQKATEAIQAFYQVRNLKSPPVRFYQSPQDVRDAIRAYTDVQIARKLGLALWIDLKGELEASLKTGLFQTGWTQLDGDSDWRRDKFWANLTRHFTIPVWSRWFGELETPLGRERRGQLIKPEAWASFGAQVDFCISELDVPCDLQLWKTFQKIVCDCGWIYPFQKSVLACNRPTELWLDPQHRLHTEAKPAISFADDLKLYAYHGVQLPDEYGQLPTSEWQAEWILEQPNAELRRVLIQAIGYTRICDELNAIPLDSWREYTLLQIPVPTSPDPSSEWDIRLISPADLEEDLEAGTWKLVPEVEFNPWGSARLMDVQQQEAVHLLRMVCPSTGHIHTIRVPPTIPSAREAARWINHDIDPEEFVAET